MANYRSVMPKMTGYSTSGIKVSASSEEGWNYACWRLFDGNTDNSSWGTNNSNYGWVLIDFGSAKYRIRKLDLYCKMHNSNYPHKWRFEGSNNNLNWDTLISVNNSTSLNRWISYAFNNTQKYRYYRFNILQGSGGNSQWNLTLTQLKLFEDLDFKVDGFLLQNNKEYYTIKNSELEKLPQPFDIVDAFKNYSFYDINLINDSIYKQLSTEFKILYCKFYD